MAPPPGLEGLEIALQIRFFILLKQAPLTKGHRSSLGTAGLNSSVRPLPALTTTKTWPLTRLAAVVSLAALQLCHLDLPHLQLFINHLALERPLGGPLQLL